jgi:hypothetical protein
MTMLALGGVSESLWAALAALALTTSAPGPSRDVEVTVAVRRALSADPELDRAGITVHVEDGVVVLRGGVASAELIARAVRKAERVKGVLDVKSELSVRLPPPPTLFPRPADKVPAQARADEPPRRVDPPTAPSKSAPPAAIPAATRARTPSGVEIGPPLPDRGGREAGPTRVVVRSIDPAATVSVAGEIEKIRSRDARFRLIRVDVSGAALVVRGGAPDAAMDFAEKLQEIKGVDNVVVDQGRPRR